MSCSVHVNGSYKKMEKWKWFQNKKQTTVTNQGELYLSPR